MAAQGALSVVAVATIAELRRWWDGQEPAVEEPTSPTTMQEAILSCFRAMSDLDWEEARREWAAEQPTKEISPRLLRTLQDRSAAAQNNV
jgi:hypothetical protein